MIWSRQTAVEMVRSGQSGFSLETGSVGFADGPEWRM